MTITSAGLNGSPLQETAPEPWARPSAEAFERGNENKAGARRFLTAVSRQEDIVEQL